MTEQTRSTQDWQRADAAHFLHPFTDHKQLANKGTRIITRGNGIYLWDSEDQKILDAMSGLWCVSLGYGQESLIEAATRQLRTLPFYNSFFQTTTEPAIRLAEKLAEVTPPQFRHVFFTGSGSEGNDTVIRLVRRYWELEGQPGRQVIISRRNAYHGSTMGGASLSGMAEMHAQGGLPIPDIVHVGQPYWRENGMPRGIAPDAFGLEAAHWLEERILELGPDRIAAFIGEPVQGAGGVIIPPDTYWPEIQRICDKYDILLVSDEVICGFGRTGQWFGCEHFGTRPDLMTFAKGVTSGYIPLGGVMIGERVARTLVDKGGEFAHGYTYSGHPVACAVGVATIEFMQRQGVVEHVHDVLAPQLARICTDLAGHPLVGVAESCGMMAGFLLVREKSAGTPFAPESKVGMICREHCFANGLIMRAVGDRMIIAPPLVMTPGQMDEMAQTIRKCLDLTLEDLQHRGWLPS